MSNSKKVLLVGWDAADWKIIHKLMDEGLMPTVSSMVENGVMGNMRTLFPSLSPMLWTTIATGKRPYKHGIYGFTEPAPNGKSVQAISNLTRKCKAIWNILGQNDLRSLVVGWWPSHPAEPIDGCMVSDFFHKVPKRPDQPWRLMKQAIHPASMYKELEELRIHPNHLTPQDVLPFVPHAEEIDQKVDSRLSTVMKMICECTSIHGAATHLLETEEWDFAAIYYDAIDHFCHGFMRYHPPQLPNVSDQDFKFYSNVVSMGYQYHDMMLARLLELAGEDTTVILMSDHGFHPDHLRAKLIPTEPAGPAIEHRDYGIFLAKGPGIKKDEVVHGAGLMDVTPTILTLYGLPVGEDMDGRALTEIFSEEKEVETIDSWENVAGNDGRHPEGYEFDPAESKEALEQLIALGYVERPDDNYEIAIKKCVTELDYNLARSYMDAGMHGEAIPLLLNLYNDSPLEFRFGIQLANCLNAMNRTSDLEILLKDLNDRWRVASEQAKERIRDIAAVARQRRKQWKKLKEIDKKNKEQGIQAVRLAEVNHNGKPKLFNESEYYDIRKIRAIARGNPQTLDFLNATIATAKGEFEEALDLLEKAEITKAKNAAFLYQVGNVYLGLERTDDAERVYGKSLEIDEYYPESLMGLCRVYLAKSQSTKAVDYGRQAVGLKYHFPLAHFFLGHAKFRSGDIPGAIASYQTAIEQNPNFAEAHKSLAHIYKTKAIDENLELEHQSLAKQVEEGRGEYAEQQSTIQIKTSDAVDYSDVLPKFETSDETEKDAPFVPCIGQMPVQLNSEQLDSTDSDDQKEIIIVTGLPRSGTSMMMQMLVAGGLEVHSDGRRQADESNPKGYFESEEVKKLAHANRWLDQCGGKVVKVVAPLIPYLSQRNKYRVVMMNRNIDEILASQEKMLERLDREGGNLTSDKFEKLFKTQLQHCRQLFTLHEIPVLELNYSEIIRTPEKVAQEISNFIPANLDFHNMASVVDPDLYREKSS